MTWSYVRIAQIIYVLGIYLGYLVYLSTWSTVLDPNPGRGGGGGGALGTLNSYKDNGAPSPCHQDSEVLWRLRRGGGALGGAKILQMIMSPPSPSCQIPRVNSSGLKSFFFTAIKCWNSLPSCVRNIDLKQPFKSMLKKTIWDQMFLENQQSFIYY